MQSNSDHTLRLRWQQCHFHKLYFSFATRGLYEALQVKTVSNFLFSFSLWTVCSHSFSVGKSFKTEKQSLKLAFVPLSQVPAFGKQLVPLHFSKIMCKKRSNNVVQQYRYRLEGLCLGLGCHQTSLRRGGL